MLVKQHNKTFSINCYFFQLCKKINSTIHHSRINYVPSKRINLNICISTNSNNHRAFIFINQKCSIRSTIFSVNTRSEGYNKVLDPLISSFHPLVNSFQRSRPYQYLGVLKSDCHCQSLKTMSFQDWLQLSYENISSIQLTILNGTSYTSKAHSCDFHSL